MPSPVQIIPIAGLPEIRQDDNLGALIIDAVHRQGEALEDGDVLVVTQKAVSKAEGRLVDLASVTPSPLAIQIASEHQRDPRHTEVVLRESKRIVRMDRGVIIAETRHGFRCANAGVDASNVGGKECVALLPEDSDASARRIRAHILKSLSIDLAVIISDTFGRPWREGAANAAIGAAGINPLLDYRGQEDPNGYELRTTTIAIADELASAAELVMGKLDRVPVALIKGYPYPRGDTGIGVLIRPPERDLFR
ncbi:MAG: coenzyme F420-0:L-glutamate ligase [SAR202 cluster bacterium]|nr:coenzyme F420-0:L-glutamate ligase [SAR202 cluster bacterium]